VSDELLSSLYVMSMVAVLVSAVSVSGLKVKTKAWTDVDE
jgi:hypothetical protein